MQRVALAAAVALSAGLVVPTYGALIADFEGSADGFVAVDAATATVDNTTGSDGSSSSLRVTDPATGWGDAALQLSNITWSEFVGATLKVDIRANNADNSAGWLQIYPVMNSQNGGWQQATDADRFEPMLDDQWHTYEWTIPALPADPGGWREIFFLTNSGAARAFWIDNVITEPVPEPASLSLLALGGLLLTRRTRRN